jgi:hypothetical protein
MGFVMITCAFVVVALEGRMFAHVDVSITENETLDA